MRLCPTAGRAEINFGGPILARCADNGVHFTGIIPVRWTPFFLVRPMNIAEQVECHSSAAADPARRCRIKCYAAGVGALGLLLVILVGAISGAPDGVQHNLTQATGSVSHD